MDVALEAEFGKADVHKMLEGGWRWNAVRGTLNTGLRCWGYLPGSGRGQGAAHRWSSKQGPSEYKGGEYVATVLLVGKAVQVRQGLIEAASSSAATSSNW
jgi:hypothetical protein